MWRTGIAALTLLALAGCGDDDSDGGKAAKTVTASPSEAKPSASALADTCAHILEIAPEKYPANGWRDVLEEANFLTTADDADVRDAARDLVDAVRPIVTAWEHGASVTGWERITTRFGEEWQSFRDEWCPGA